MRYRSVLLFALVTAWITAYGLLLPNFLIEQVIGNSINLVVVRISLAVLLAGYVLIDAFRVRELQLLLRLGGAVLFGYGLAAIFSPMLFGMTDSYVPLGDVFIWVEGGILAMLVSLDIPIKSTTRISTFQQFKNLLAAIENWRSLGQT